jgi:hypothetical protein
MRIENLKKAGIAVLASLGELALTAGGAYAATKDPLNSGDTAWMITSSALVLMMTIPGLALFYGGMVRKKNVLATLAQSFGATCIITVLWMIIGYSIAFTANPNAGTNNWIGGFNYLFLAPMGLNAVSSLAGTIPESVYMFFQMTFAIITPALIAGALADRMKFGLHVVHGPVADLRLLPHRPLGVGRRLAGHDGRAGLCRRHGGASQCRYRGAGDLPGLGQAHRAGPRAHVAA